MPAPTGAEAFRSHWLAFPVSQLFDDGEPDAPHATIEIRTGDQPAVIGLGGGEITTHIGTARAPDLVLEGDAPVILGALTGLLELEDAHRLGLRSEGSTTLLRRLRYQAPDVEASIPPRSHQSKS